MPRNSFLDQGGLGYLWSKVLSRISSSESSITAKIPIASDDLPKDLGSSSSGVSSKFSRSDHVHKVPDDIVSYADAQTGVEETTKINADLLENHPASDFAPSGFGLGQENMVAINDCNNAVLSGWYTTDATTANTPAEDTNSGVLCVSRRYDNRIYQEFHAISGGQYSAGTASRISYGDNHTAPQWGPWEWVNPPMILGTEYRTTERYLGRPVYCKVVNCGNSPDGTTAEVAHGIANVGIVVGAQAIASNSTDMFNGLVYLPDIRSGSLTDRWTIYLAGADKQNIRIFCGGGLAGRLVYVTLKYTKTTD